MIAGASPILIPFKLPTAASRSAIGLLDRRATGPCAAAATRDGACPAAATAKHNKRPRDAVRGGRTRQSRPASFQDTPPAGNAVSESLSSTAAQKFSGRPFRARDVSAAREVRALATHLRVPQRANQWPCVTPVLP